MIRATLPMNFDDAYKFLIELEGDKKWINPVDGPEYRGLLQKYYEPGLHMLGFPMGERLPDSVLDLTEEQHEHYVFVKFWERLFFEKRGAGFVCVPEMKLLQGVAAPIFFMFYSTWDDAIKCAQRTSRFLKDDGNLGPLTYSFLHSIGAEHVLEWWKSKTNHPYVTDRCYFSMCYRKYIGHPKEAGLVKRLEKIDLWLRQEIKEAGGEGE